MNWLSDIRSSLGRVAVLTNVLLLAVLIIPAAALAQTGDEEFSADFSFPWIGLAKGIAGAVLALLAIAALTLAFVAFFKGAKSFMSDKEGGTAGPFVGGTLLLFVAAACIVGTAAFIPVVDWARPLLT